DGNQLDVTVMDMEEVDERRGRRGRVTQQMPSGVLGSFRDRREDLRLLLRAHAFEAFELSSLCGGSEVVDALDVQRRVQHRHRLRTHTLKTEQVENRRGELLEQLLVILARARLSQFANARG